MTRRIHRTDTVTVYGFRKFDPDLREMQLAAEKATRSAIANMPFSELLPATAEDVPRDALDARGHFRRVATGWGELH